ncbi:hypothetical protein [Streptomyces sp. NPDC001948]
MNRYRVTLTVEARTVMSGWWSDEATAERKCRRWIGERGSVGGTRIALTDEWEGGRVVMSWPETDR